MTNHTGNIVLLLNLKCILYYCYSAEIYYDFLKKVYQKALKSLSQPRDFISYLEKMEKYPSIPLSY